jgi:hypothetical protein
VIKGDIKREMINDSRRSMYGEPDRNFIITDQIRSGFADAGSMILYTIPGMRPSDIPDAEDVVPTVRVDANPNGNQNEGIKLNNNKSVPTLFLVDGNLVPGYVVKTIRPSEIESIDLLTDIAKIAIYGPRVQNLFGKEKVINIMTKKSGNSKNIYLKPYQTIQGFTTAKEFFEPKYALKQDKSTPDYRSTIYWNPNIKTDANGKASISFYNSDIAKKFQVVVEGIDEKGSFGSFNGVLD